MPVDSVFRYHGHLVTRPAELLSHGDHVRIATDRLIRIRERAVLGHEYEASRGLYSGVMADAGDEVKVDAGELDVSATIDVELSAEQG